MKVYELKKELNYKGRTKIIDFQSNRTVSVARQFFKYSVHDEDKVVFYRYVPFYNVRGQLINPCGILEVFVIQPYFDRDHWRWVNCE